MFAVVWLDVSTCAHEHTFAKRYNGIPCSRYCSVHFLRLLCLDFYSYCVEFYVIDLLVRSSTQWQGTSRSSTTKNDLTSVTHLQNYIKSDTHNRRHCLSIAVLAVKTFAAVCANCHTHHTTTTNRPNKCLSKKKILSFSSDFFCFKPSAGHGCKANRRDLRIGAHE